MRAQPPHSRPPRIGEGAPATDLLSWSGVRRAIQATLAAAIDAGCRDKRDVARRQQSLRRRSADHRRQIGIGGGRGARRPE
jgi:hypothetical protein